jgi:hypothetical protein
MIKGYSAQELSHAIRLEKNGLCVERRGIVKRLNEIDNRITELDSHVGRHEKPAQLSR